MEELRVFFTRAVVSALVLVAAARGAAADDVLHPGSGGRPSVGLRGDSLRLPLPDGLIETYRKASLW
jgi:hypothetical protein